MMSIIAVDANSSFRSYYTDPNGVVVIEMHNEFNKAKEEGSLGLGMAVVVKELDGTLVDSVKFSVTFNEGVGYFDNLAPNNKDWDYWPSKSHRVVLPPNVILSPEYFPNAPAFLEEFGVWIECNYNTVDGDAEWQYTNLGTPYAVTPVGNQIRTPVMADTLEVITGKSREERKVWKFDKPDPCQDLVVCRWTSLTGVVRQHFFPIVSYIKGNGEQVPLVSAGDGYEVSKSNFTAVRCRLTGLTPYGVWYYLDILQASDLHAIIQPTISQFRTEIASPMTAAFIDSDGGETPQGSGFSNFEFTINMRQYGKV